MTVVKTLALLLVVATIAMAQANSPNSDREEVIAVDTVWGGVREVAKTTRVNPGATLVVLPGTVVRFAVRPGAEIDANVRLVVKGQLVAQGRADAPVVFTSSAQEPRAGDWGGVVFDSTQGATNRLEWCRVEYATEAVSVGLSPVLLEHCELRRNQTALVAVRKVGGGVFDCDLADNLVGLRFNQSTGFTVENSRVKANAEEGMVFSFGSSARVRNCEVVGNGRVGIACVQGSSPLIEANVIRGHARGISLELKSNPAIVHNDITQNGTGVWAEKLVSPQITENRITGNGVGIYCNFSAYPEIHNNDLAGNRDFALVLGNNQSIVVERQIPYRSQGQFYQVPLESEILPPKTHKHEPFSGEAAGAVNAQGNWWGEVETALLRAQGADANLGAVEDRHDKPNTEYQGEWYPRDVVALDGWADKPVTGAGRPEVVYAGVAGKILFNGRPLAGARVHVHRDASDAFHGEGLTYSSPAGDDGQFSVTLAPGRYFLVAKRTDQPFPSSDPAPGEHFSYYGGNPVRVVAGNMLEVNLRTVRREAISRGEGGSPGTGTIRGQVMGPQGPVRGASVFVYPNADTDFRGPDLFGPSGGLFEGSDEAGGFELEVPPGRYAVVAVQRKGLARLGPLHPGDLYGYFDGNPVEVRDGEIVRGTIQVVEKLREAERSMPGEMARLSGIQGVVREQGGTVPQGVFVFASPSPTMMGGMPPFRSDPVGEDGRYFLDLPRGGIYYVGARSGYGGPPLPGEWYGVHGGEKPAPVEVEGGTITEGVDVTVRTME